MCKLKQLATRCSLRPVSVQVEHEQLEAGGHRRQRYFACFPDMTARRGRGARRAYAVPEVRACHNARATTGWLAWLAEPSQKATLSTEPCGQAEAASVWMSA